MANLELVQKLKLELIRGYEKYVRAVAGLTQSSEDDAREALHRAACELFVGLRKRPADNPAIAWRPYVIRAAVNLLRKEIKQRKRVILFSELDKEGRRELLAIRDPRPTPEEHLERKETAAILWTEVETLSPREAEVLKRWAHGSGYQKIARDLGIEPSTVRELWSRGIRDLRMRPRIQKLVA
jgi:RNA polymerase sigma factor (sigma-70 family)